MTKSQISRISLLVPSYERGIEFYVDVMGFKLIEDTDLGAGKRWVVVAPDKEVGTDLLLAKAANPEQMAAVGNQSGGRVFLFLNTDDFDGEYARLKTAGVKFLEQPREEPYAKVVVFEDPFGNKWDLLETKNLTP
ncbi:MAG: VOC family protein [Alphaproteobacteria bacterium]